MSWEDQGRKEHGWFGDGKGPEKSGDISGAADPFSPGGFAQRLEEVAYGVIGALPPVTRVRAAAQYDAGNLARLTAALAGWIAGTRFSEAEFADRFFGRAADDPVVRHLHGAALDAGLATTHTELRDAAEKIASAVRTIGLDRWPGFLADAQDRARDPDTVAAIAKSEKPRDPVRDAIRPVYPVETLLGVAAAGVAGGVAAAIRAVGGAIMKQVSPKSAPSTGGASEESMAGAGQAEKPLNPGRETPKMTEASRPSLPARPDDLLAQGWKETTHPKAGATGRRTFVNPKTGQTVEFDKARPDESGWRGQDHYHLRNPDSTSRHDRYLDKNGRAVRAGSEPSHLPPDM